MRKAIFYICSLLVSISSLGQEVIIGTGTSTTTTNPINSYYGYNYTQQIYTSAEITAGGGTAGQSITKIKFYWAGGGNLTNANTWVVYLGNTTQATFSDGTNWVALGSLTQVYNGVVTLPASAGWMTITLTTPYVWTGNNLVVAIDENVASYASTAATWRYTSTSTNYRSIYYYSDGTNPDPAAPPTGTRTYNRPNVSLVFPAMDQNWPGENLGTLSCPSTTTYTGSTVGAADNCTYSTGADHIYSFTVGYDFDAVISLCNAGTNFDTKLYLYNITNGSCNDGSYIAYSDDGASCGLESEISVTGLTAGTYVVVIEGYSGATGNYEMDITLSNCGLAGDNCSNAQNLAVLTSPFSGTTVGYTDDIANCRTGYPDRIFYLDVDNGCSVDIWQSVNSYDSYHYMGYGASCPGTQIYCIDDSDTQNNPWTNNTGSTQRVWFIVDGFSGSGTFTLNWSLVCCEAPATVTASVSSTTVTEGSSLTFDYASHTGGACGSGNWEYEWRDNSGTVVRPWSTTSAWTPTMSSGGTFTYYLYMRCSSCTSDVTQSNSLSVTVVCLPPANPANPTASANACGDKTLSFTGTPPAGVTWYWQSACNGTSTANSSSSTIVSTSGTYYLTAYTSSNSCWSTGCGSLTVSVEQTPPIPSINDTTVCEGENTLTAYASGTCVTYNWYDAASGGTLLNTGATYDVSITSPTTYYVEATNSGNFEVTLQSTNSYVVDHLSATGDDRGGIAITPNYLYVTGDSYTTRFDLPLSLLTGTSFTIKDGLFSDLATGDLWELYNGSAPVSGTTLTGYNVTSLRKLDEDLAYTGTTLTLSSSFTIGDEGGIYAGKGFVIIQDGDTDNFYHIDLATGTLTSLGIFTTTGRSYSESWATWGIAEFDGCSYSVLYANNSADQISRIDLGDGTVSTAATFSNISDMTSFTISPWENRWYFHYELSGQFGGTDETAGYADATITETTGICSSSRDNFTVSVTSPPLTPDGSAYPPAVPPGGITTLSASGTGGTITWFDDKCNGNIIGTGTTLVVTPPYTTNYFVATYNGCYSECDTVPVQVVQPCNVYAFGNGLTDTIDICSGDVVDLSATASCDYMMNNDFNDGTMGVGWSSSCSPMFNNPCDPGPDGTTYLWIGNDTDFPRELVTQAYTVTDQCRICFDMDYASQSGTSPCEGIDLPDEGIHVQWSIDGGTTWTDIHYYDPDPDGNGDGGYDPQMTSWNNYCLNIPAVATSANTQFRFFQDVTSGYDYDHWGLDNVEISCPGSGMTVQWSHGPTVLDPVADVTPTTSTEYTVIVDDGFNLGNADTSSIYINVIGAPVVSDESACTSGSSVTITASGGTDYAWYDAPTGGTLLGTGSTYTIPSLTSDQTLYVEFNSPSWGPVNYTFDSDMEGWTVQAPCVGSNNWAWNSDGGNGTLFAVDPSVSSSQVIFSPVQDVSTYSGSLTLSYLHKYTTESCCDHGFVAYRLDGGAWVQFTPTTGSYSGIDDQNSEPLWNSCGTGVGMGLYFGTAAYSTHSGDIDVSSASTFQIAFVFTSDGSVSSTGWYIDEVTISGGGAGACPNSRAEVNAYLSELNADYSSDAISCYGNNDGEMTAIAVDGMGTPIPGIFTYLWETGATSQTVIDVSAGSYDVTITDEFGCTSTTSVSVSGPTMPTEIVSSTGISGSCNIVSPDDWVYIVNSADNTELIASVFDAAGGNDLYLTTAEATIFPSVQYSGSMPYLQRVVRVTPVSSGSAMVRIYFSNAEFAALQIADPTIVSVADLAVTKCDDAGSWVNCLLLTPSTFGVSPIGTGYYAEVSVTSFSKFYIHKNNGWVLPVELVNFSSVCEGDMLRIKWATASEKNNSHFVLEKSLDLENFEEVAVIEGAGNSDSHINYEILVNNLNDEASYFRLKQVDYDGAFEYSEFISVKCKESNSEIDFSVYSESNGDLMLFFSGNNVENSKFDLLIMDLTGRILSNQKIVVNSENQKFTISNLDLSAGIYNLVLRNEMKVITKSVVVVR